MTIIIIILVITLIIFIFKYEKKITTSKKYVHELITYNEDILELLNLINNHRSGLNLTKLIPDQFLTDIAKQHCLYMVELGKISHDGFSERSNLVLSKGASFVGEIVAAGYTTNLGILNAYLNSPLHKKQIELPPYNIVGIVKINNEKNKMFNVILFGQIKLN